MHMSGFKTWSDNTDRFYVLGPDNCLKAHLLSRKYELCVTTRFSGQLQNLFSSSALFIIL